MPRRVLVVKIEEKEDGYKLRELQKFYGEQGAAEYIAKHDLSMCGYIHAYDKILIVVI